MSRQIDGRDSLVAQGVIGPDVIQNGVEISAECLDPADQIEIDAGHIEDIVLELKMAINPPARERGRIRDKVGK